MASRPGTFPSSARKARPRDGWTPRTLKKLSETIWPMRICGRALGDAAKPTVVNWNATNPASDWFLSRMSRYSGNDTPSCDAEGVSVVTLRTWLGCETGSGGRRIECAGVEDGVIAPG